MFNCLRNHHTRPSDVTMGLTLRIISSSLPSSTSPSIMTEHHLYILFRKDQTFSSQRLYSLASVSPLLLRHQQHLCILVHMILLDLAPKHFAKYNWFVSTRSIHSHLLLHVLCQCEKEL